MTLLHGSPEMLIDWSHCPAICTRPGYLSGKPALRDDPRVPPETIIANSNGVLLGSADHAGFDVMVTCDQNMRHQNNLTRVSLGLIVLSTNAWRVIHKDAARVVDTVDMAAPGSCQFIEFLLPPHPGRKPVAQP